MAVSLLECVKKTDCVKSGKDLKECVKAEKIDPECAEYRTAYFECKRGALDMRNRIRGQKGMY